jgi:hypothetical protein
MQTLNLWDSYTEPVVKPEISRIIESSVNTASSIVNEVEKPQNKRKKYIITADKNNQGRQLYLFAPEDEPDNWNIGIIPCPLIKTRCKKLIQKAQQDLEIKAANSKVKNIRTDIPFEIMEWNPPEETTEKENIAKGYQILEELRKKRELNNGK